MKQEFKEALKSDCCDPVDAQDQDFDWQRLYERLDQDAHSTDNDPRLAELVIRLLQMLVPEAEHRQVSPHNVGLRLIALAWVLNPAYFEGSPSVRELARRCGVHAATLARFTGEISRMIRWRNRAQRHAWNWHRDQRPALGDGHDDRTAQRNATGASAVESTPNGSARGNTPTGA